MKASLLNRQRKSARQVSMPEGLGTREKNRAVAVRVAPVRSDDFPLSEDTVSGTLQRLNADDVILDLGVSIIPTDRVVMGVELPAGDFAFAVLEVLEQYRLQSHLRIQASVATGARDILTREKLRPILQAESWRYETGMVPEAIDAWMRMEVLTPRLLDRVLCCPDCSGLLTTRRGCAQCGSVRTRTERMMHHYACAHVQPVSAFETPYGLVCPKCLTRDLVVGSDFEFFDGVTRCMDCASNVARLAIVCECLACQLRIPDDLAIEKDLITHDVHRLDSLVDIPLTQ